MEIMYYSVMTQENWEKVIPRAPANVITYRKV